MFVVLWPVIVVTAYQWRKNKFEASQNNLEGLKVFEGAQQHRKEEQVLLSSAPSRPLAAVLGSTPGRCRQFLLLIIRL